jgi:serine/threonine protein kinase
VDGKMKALMKERSGTMQYMAPELAPVPGQKEYMVGTEIDIWAFGVLLYEMCVAYKPT